MRAFACPVCQNFASFEQDRCGSAAPPWACTCPAGPWEDFAECFAHYLHITDTIDTAREAGMVLHADRVRFAGPHDIVPLESYADVPIEQLMFDGKWMSLFFNRVNTAMGKNPLYPFEIGMPVVDKLGFVRTVVRQPT